MQWIVPVDKRFTQPPVVPEKNPGVFVIAYKLLA
jgi:hypothetical protein